MSQSTDLLLCKTQPREQTATLPTSTIHWHQCKPEATDQEPCCCWTSSGIPTLLAAGGGCARSYRSQRSPPRRPLEGGHRARRHPVTNPLTNPSAPPNGPAASHSLGWPARGVGWTFEVIRGEMLYVAGAGGWVSQGDCIVPDSLPKVDPLGGDRR